MSLLRAVKIQKQYPGTLALDQVDAQFESGKVNALIGKNGSGKSTLVKIFSGVESRTGGQLFLDDTELHIHTPQDASKYGIHTVYQELSLIPGLSVAENIFLNNLPMKGFLVDKEAMYRQAEEILQDLGVPISSRETVSNLSMWQCQMIEIVKVMSKNPKVIFLDEPTSSLAAHETGLLFDMIRQLKKKDVVIVYISHRLQELWEIADSCTVLRDGKYIGKADMSATSHRELVQMMFGDMQVRTRPPDLEISDKVCLEVEGLSRKNKFADISFRLYEKEVLGIAGMLGSGRTELLKSIFGADPFDSGCVLFEGRSFERTNPVEMKQAGMALTPEDRKNEGLIQILSVQDNLVAASLDTISNGAFVVKARETEFVHRQVNDLQIKVPSVANPVWSLSGGNQQKVVVGNWLNTSPKVMLFDEPTRGIDVNAKQQIFQIIWEQSRLGISSIIVSSELEELIEVCHRILVLRNGQITGEVIPQNTSVEELYALCMA